MLEAMQEHSVTVSKLTHRCQSRSSCWRRRTRLKWKGPTITGSTAGPLFFKNPGGIPHRRRIDSKLPPAPLPPRRRLPTRRGWAKIRTMQMLARGVPIANHVMAYAAHVLKATHPEEETSPKIVREFVRYGGVHAACRHSSGGQDSLLCWMGVQRLIRRYSQGSCSRPASPHFA